MTTNKHWYESKTIWINILTLLAMVLSAIAGWEEFKDIAPNLLVGVNVLNIALRFITSEGIK